MKKSRFPKSVVIKVDISPVLELGQLINKKEIKTVFKSGKTVDECKKSIKNDFPNYKFHSHAEILYIYSEK